MDGGRCGRDELEGSSLPESYWNMPIKRDIWFMNSNFRVGTGGEGWVVGEPLSVITIMIKCAAMRLFNLVL